MTSIDNLIELLKGKARAELERTGEYEPKAFFFLKLPDIPNPIFYYVKVSHFFNYRLQFLAAKSDVPQYLKMQWLKKKAEHTGKAELLAVCVISDTWYAEVHLKENETFEQAVENTPRPSKHPNRKEALHFMINYPDRIHSCQFYYKRVKKRIEFYGVENIDKHEDTWMCRLYPK